MESNSVLDKKIHPIRQASGVAILVLAILTLVKLANYGITGDANLVTYWEVAAAGLLFYAMMNSVLSIAYDNQNTYWLYSIIGFAGLLVVCGSCAFLYSGISIDEAGSFRWIFLVFTMGYIILLAIVRTMKKIMTIAQREDARLRGED